MFGPRIALSVAFGLLTAAVVITLAGYYESPRLLLFQIALIAGPTIVPLMPLPRDGPAMVPGWVAVALLMSAGWAYVIYIDTRPYTGGGASFASCSVGSPASSSESSRSSSQQWIAGAAGPAESSRRLTKHALLKPRY